MSARTPRHGSRAVRLFPYVPAPATNGSLALRPGGPAQARRPGAGPSPVRPPTPPAKALRRGRPAGRAPVIRSRPAAAGAEEPQLRIAAEATVRMIAEVLAGIRPSRQLERLASPQVCGELAAIAPAMPARGPIRAPRVLASWLQRPTPQAAEAGAVVTVAGRVQALALRLERRRGRWRCTVLETTASRR